MDYVMVTPAYPPLVGGVERHVCEVHRALGRRGWKGRIAVLRESPAAAPRCDDVSWLETGRLWGCVPKTARLRLGLKIVGVVAGYPEAVLHFHDYQTIDPILPLLRSFGYLRRAYLTFHGWEGQYPPEPSVIVRRQVCAKSVRGNISIGAFIPKWYGTPTDIVSYGGVDVARYSSASESCGQLPFRVAYLGRFERDSGILELVEASKCYSRVSAQGLELHLFGAGSLGKDLRKLEDRNGVFVKVSPPVQDSFDVLRAFPIVFTSGYLTMLEGLCARRIVFAYYNNPLREDYVRLHPASRAMFVCGSVQDVVAGLTQCQQDIRKACQFSEPGWRWAREQSWDNVASQYLKLWGLQGEPEARTFRACCRGRTAR